MTDFNDRRYDPEQLRAVRRVAGKKTTIHILQGDREIGKAGGARAARAQGAIVTLAHNGTEPYIALRGDHGAAISEAHRLETQTHVRNRGHLIPVNPAKWSRAVPIEEEM